MGDLGEHAFRFIDFLQSTSQKIWQTLPLGPTHGDLSPYQCLSSNAGNPALIDIRVLEQQGLISETDIKALPDEDTLITKRRCIAQAWKQLSKQENE
ncbi:MAG: 4-alpha-glucanotransferase, partial [Gammaproteobacteria bacterium]|nr:4-alpha-glucanotransferase [Gammaproteobacteria bacterium]